MPLYWVLEVVLLAPEEDFAVSGGGEEEVLDGERRERLAADPDELGDGFAVEVLVGGGDADLGLLGRVDVPEVDLAVEGAAGEHERVRRVEGHRGEAVADLDGGGGLARVEVAAEDGPDADGGAVLAPAGVVGLPVRHRQLRAVAVPRHRRHLEVPVGARPLAPCPRLALLRVAGLGLCAPPLVEAIILCLGARRLLQLLGRLPHRAVCLAEVELAL